MSEQQRDAEHIHCGHLHGARLEHGRRDARGC